MKQFYFFSKIQSITIIIIFSTCLSFNVNARVTDEAPALTSVSILTGATEDTQFTITYATLAAAADESDADGDPLSFRITGVSTGTLTKGGVEIVPGITLISIGEWLVWTPGVNANDILNAFTITAWDGLSHSNTAVQVQVNVTAVNDTPSVNAGLNGMIAEGSTFSGSGSFSDPDVGDTYTVRVIWGDAGSMEFLAFDAATKTFGYSHTYVENGVFNVTIRIDNDGEIGIGHVVVTVTNVDPATSAGADVNVNEGSSISQSGSFTDPGIYDTYTAQANYGDGSSVQPLAVDQIAKTFNLNHVYTDNGMYTITVTVMDDDGAIGADQVAVTIFNVPPVTIAGADLSVNEGSSISQPGSFIDPGTDTYTAQADYGNGNSVQPLAVDQIAKTFNLNHVYTDNGVYVITVTVMDDDGAISTDQVVVTVLNVAPSDMTISASSINENIPDNSVIGSLSTTDTGAENTFTYTLVNGTGDTDNASFNINGDRLRITNSPDFETKSSYSLRVRTTDQGSLSFEKVFTISINDVIENVAPVVITQAVTDVSGTGATGKGNITDLGVPNPTQYGVVWSPLSNPTIDLMTKTEQGAIAATGAYSSPITGLSVNTRYYLKAYATNSAGTSYGDEVTFTTLLTEVISLDLKTVKIYPNPADDEVNISTDISDNGLYTILSPSGIMLANGVISNGEARINLEKFSSGIYIVQIQIGSKKASFKIIKK